MKIKVCGMRDAENIKSLIALKPDFIGFIFYNKSKRFVSEFPQIKFPKAIKKVGVFVNESLEEVLKISKKHQLVFVQLHGNETPEFCQKLVNMFTDRSRSEKPHHSELGLESFEIIKAFSVDENFNFEQTKPFEKYCKYFLFDAKGTNYGGNGIKFNWEMLQNYKGEVPFLLSGGITKKDANEIKRINHPKFIGVDVNSGFEIEPGLKNIQDIKEFKNSLI
jgi:phosphoribosylanthranilate isomerase